MISELNAKFSLNMKKLLPDLCNSNGCVNEDVTAVVALSGGADSTALTLLTNEWAKSTGIRIFAVTVDHALRPESADEARKVGLWMKDVSIDHYILKWNHDNMLIPFGRKQVYARRARYDLLLDFCKKVKANYLFIAHTLDDQIETFFMRSESHSGEYGLAGINAKSKLAVGVTVLRPLLNIYKLDIKSYLIAKNYSWVEDPSNNDTHYKRVRIRTGIAAKSNKNSIWREIQALGSKRCESEKQSSDFVNTKVIINKFGYAIFQISDFNQLDIDIQKYVTRRLLWSLGGKQYPVSDNQLEIILKDMKNLTKGSKINFGGCLIARKRESFHIMRELRNINKKELMKQGFWDRRFWISSNSMVQIASAGIEAASELKERFTDNEMIKEGFASIPAIYDSLSRKSFWFNHEESSCIAKFLPIINTTDEFTVLN